jgi:tetratricopeptide (TPR) repeat protein
VSPRLHARWVPSIGDRRASNENSRAHCGVADWFFLSFQHSALAQSAKEASQLNNRAVELSNSGRYSEAEPIFKRALAIREKTLGPNHPDVATTLSYLALLYHDHGRDADAEPLFKRSLAIHEKVLSDRISLRSPIRFELVQMSASGPTAADSCAAVK